MKINSATCKIIILINFILINLNGYSNSIINLNDEYCLDIPNKFIDSIKLETNYGFIKIENECDSNSSMTYMSGMLYYSFLKKTLEESEKLNIDSDKGYLIFELNYKGQLLECKLGKLAKLNEFNILLQQFVIEINLKYKDKTITNCNDKINKDNTYFEVPFKFQKDEEY